MTVADGSGLLCDGKQQVENALTGVRGEAGPGSPEGRLPKLPVTQLSQACSGYIAGLLWIPGDSRQHLRGTGHAKEFYIRMQDLNIPVQKMML